MATNIQLVTYAGQTVTPLDDALFYEKAVTSGIISGCECTLSGGNTLHMAGGHGIICGRKFTVFESDTPIPLSSGGTLNGRMKVHLDLADTGEPIKFVIETAAQLPDLTRENDVNINNGIYEFNMCTFSVSETAVSDFWQAFPPAMARGIPIRVPCGSISRLPVTIKDSRIISDMEFTGYMEMSNEAAMTSKWNVNTVDGAVTISGSISGTTTLLIKLASVIEEE